MCEFLAYVAFNKATSGQTEYKTRKGEKKLSWMSLLKIAVEKASSLAKIEFGFTLKVHYISLLAD